MIFVTVGSQMPFDRLIRAVDEWAENNQRDDVFAQIGETNYVPSHIKWCKSLEPDEFQRRVASCSLVVMHAGMGSVLTSLEFGKPMVILPRRGTLMETRNDHQVATAKWLSSKDGILVAMDEIELGERLNESLSNKHSSDKISSFASDQLTNRLKQFIFKS